MASQRIGKYACLEIERRYLLQNVPDDLENDADGWLITDRYFLNTRLRLRMMKSVSGNQEIFKLTQKFRSETQTAIETTITNLYLTEAEYNLLEPLEAKIIIKKRYPYRLKNQIFSIDVFEGRHQGLILAEIEFENETRLEEIEPPSIALFEVTEDPFFTGGNLVRMTDDEFRQGLIQRMGGGRRT